MTLDPVVQALFQQMPDLPNYPIWEKTPVQARAEVREFSEIANPKNIPIGKMENTEITGPLGPIPLRIYTPVGAGDRPIPAILFFHGGGFVVGDLDTSDAFCRMLANGSHCRVVSVAYRLAPEHRFPAAVEDCLAAANWIENNATTLGIDANHIAVAGDSAGANLAIVVTQLAKNRRLHIAYQLLLYPVTKLGGIAGERQHTNGYLLDQRMIDWFMEQYLPEKYDPNDPRISPLEAPDLKGLPPAYIITAGFDPLREEGIAYAEKLRAAGVPVTHIDYPTMIHGFVSMPAFIPLASEVISVAARAVCKALNEH